MPQVSEHVEVRVRGTVQGVGFRPTVYRLATDCGLGGEVLNDSDGVLIRLAGPGTVIAEFLRRLPVEAPPLARIDSIVANDAPGSADFEGFRISHSVHASGQTEIAADAAMCAACRDEILDPGQRRFRYPFTNCTHCGPRLSIVQGIPYDRPSTTMAAFALCPDCAAEYADPLDRRFHAQPVACHRCGPGLSLYWHRHPVGFDDADPVQRVSRQLWHIEQALRHGDVVALKGLGGFHLCCDATQARAVETLRARKRRDAKPLALMAPDLATIRRYCEVSDTEQELLQSPAAPIVLLRMREPLPADVAPLPAAIAPDSRLLGFMLAYTPLHALVCAAMDGPLVMTSGNRSGEPQIIDNAEALEKLAPMADLIVTHDRDIANRIDDSVVRVIGATPRVLRRARGYAPRSIPLPQGFAGADGILAVGAELKSTFCLVKQGAAILSQHQGDLEDPDTLDDYEHNLDLYQRLFEFQPRLLAVDLHPDYLSSKRATAMAATMAAGTVAVQHHHAHVAAAMAENGLPRTHRPLLGIAFDGLGLGDDGELWGGEFLLADYRQSRRLARLKPMALPGGAQAMRQPWRNTLAQILSAMAWAQFCARYATTDLAALLREQPVDRLRALIGGAHAPRASSAGRLFDAVAAALGLHPQQVLFEGQAAIALEMLTDPQALQQALASDALAYRFAIVEDGELLTLDPAPMWPALLDALVQGVDRGVIAARFLAGLMLGTADIARRLALSHGLHEVVLSGGCMQNALLLQGLTDLLSGSGLRCYSHAQVPSNDGGIALGQAVVAAARTGGAAATSATAQSVQGEDPCV